MSLLTMVKKPLKIGFPRVSGDEPGTTLTKRQKALFSPRERG